MLLVPKMRQGLVVLADVGGGVVLVVFFPFEEASTLGNLLAVLTVFEA